MSSIDDVLATIPMDRLAAQLGVDEETAGGFDIGDVLGGLLGGGRR